MFGLVSVISIEEVTINGVPGARGTYIDLLFETPVWNQKTILITNDAYFSIDCHAHLSTASEYADDFRTITNSFTLLPAY